MTKDNRGQKRWGPGRSFVGGRLYMVVRIWVDRYYSWWRHLWSTLIFGTQKELCMVRVGCRLYKEVTSLTENVKRGTVLQLLVMLCCFLRILLHFLVDCSSNLPPLQYVREEFQLQTGDIFNERCK